MAGRRFGKIFMIFHSFGAGTHSKHAVVKSGRGVNGGTHNLGL